MIGALGAPAWAQDAPAADAAPQTIPGVLPERFRLPGTPVPSPTPSPSPTSSPLVQPVVVPVPKPRPKAAPGVVRSPAPTPTPASSPQPRTPLPAAPKPVAPVVVPPAQVQAVPVEDRSGWPWFLLGATGLVVLAGAGWWFRKRRPPAAAEAIVPSPAHPTTAPAPRAAPSSLTQPIAIEIASAKLAFLAETVVFDLEIDVVNVASQAAEGLRPALALISASPDQDRWRAAFHAGPPPQNQGGPVDVAAGSRLRLPARLTLHREQLHVVTHAGRPMFVAMLLCDLRWRAGLSLYRCGADFLLGAAGQGARPGPIWLDRPAPPALAAIRYAPPQV